MKKNMNYKYFKILKEIKDYKNPCYDLMGPVWRMDSYYYKIKDLIDNRFLRADVFKDDSTQRGKQWTVSSSQNMFTQKGYRTLELEEEMNFIHNHFEDKCKKENGQENTIPLKEKEVLESCFDEGLLNKDGFHFQDFHDTGDCYISLEVDFKLSITTKYKNLFDGGGQETMAVNNTYNGDYNHNEINQNDNGQASIDGGKTKQKRSDTDIITKNKNTKPGFFGWLLKLFKK